MRGKTSQGRERDRPLKGLLSNVLAAPGRARSLRVALLAGASLVALAALGAPSAAQPFCVGSAGSAGRSYSGTITTLSNNGAISGGNGGDAACSDIAVGGEGGTGLANAGTIATFSNNGVISGGSGGSAAALSVADGGAGGSGVSNAPGATIRSLTNQATGVISGGSGGRGSNAGFGGAGVANAGTIATLTNHGTIGGGNGGGSATFGGRGGTGVSNAGTITTLSNSGAISGGNGGNGSPVDGTGGAGISNSGRIATLVNSGAISGGSAGHGRGGDGGTGGAGGAGVSNSGTITTLSNSGAIQGGVSGSGEPPGDSIYSAGANASIGSITNSGKIIGNVEIDNQANLNVYGGNGTTFGSWTGGTITIGGGNLTFAGGNTFVGDNITVAGTVINEDPLRFSSPVTITGNFDQMATGELDFLVGGDTPGQYGAITVTGLTTLDGALALNVTDGFRFGAGDSFDFIDALDGLSGGFATVSVDGVACSGGSNDVWLCSSVGFYFDLGIGNGGVDLSVAGVPEPSTWALLATGFHGLGGLGLRGRKRSPWTA
jgi:hypothetical protein